MALDFGTLSYSISAILYFFVAFIVLLNMGMSTEGRTFFIALILTMLWSTLMSLQLSSGAHYSFIGQALEVLRNLAWFVLLLSIMRYMRADQGESLPWFKLNVLEAISLVVPALMFVFTLLLIFIKPAYELLWESKLILAGMTLMAVIGLMLIEQVLRNRAVATPWDNRFLCLAIGTLFTLDFIIYAYSLMFKNLPPNLWTARGGVSALVAPLFVYAILKGQSANPRVNLSRQFVFHSSVLLVAGLYLLVMSGVGYYIRSFGGTWSTSLQAIFIAGALILLFVLIFSVRLRDSLRVYLSRHLFNYKYDYRDEWSRITRTLSMQNQSFPLQQRAIRAIADILRSPGGGLWLADERGRFVQAAVYNDTYVDRSIETAESELIGFMADTQWVINLDEYQENPDLYNRLPLPEWLTAMPDAWLVVPLMLHDELRGFVVLRRARIKHKLNWEDHDLLRMAGRQATSFLSQMQAAEQLIEARQFEAYNRTSAFIVHDLKTLISQLSLMTKNAARHKSNPQFIDDMIDTIDHSIQKMKHLLQQLRKGDVSNKQQAINLSELIQNVAEGLHNADPKPEITRCEADVMVMADPYQIATVITHITQNAQDATAKDGYVHLSLHSRSGWARIKIEDNGCGMEADFVRDHLFQPFASTKGLTGMGIGVYQSREYLRQIGGEIKVASQVGKGTEFNISIPLLDKQHQEADSATAVRENLTHH